MSPHPHDTGPHDDELSAEEMRQLGRKRTMKRLLVFGLPALLVLAGVVAIAIPLIKDWRAMQFVERAKELSAQGKLQEEFNNAASELQMRPVLPEVKRTYARVLLAANEPACLQVMQQLIDSGKATAEDRLELAEAALRFGDVPLAEKEAFNLLQKGESTPKALYVLSRVRIAQQRVPDAMQALRESLEAGGGAEPAVLLARLQIAQNTPDSLKSATDLLRPVARQQDQAGLDALLVLVASPALKSEEGAGWIEALRAHPLATEPQKLAAASAEIQLRPSAYAEVVKRTVDRYRDGTVEQRAELARWLNQNREYEGVLDVITPADASGRSDLFLVRLDAMAGKRDWKGIAELLRGENLPLQTPVVLLYRGRAARELGKPEEAATFYRRAVVESAPTRDVMWYVINYLQRIGEDKVLEQELKALTDNPSTARQAFAALVPIVQKRQDAEELYLLYDRMLQRLPADTVVQNDHRYFAALTGRRADVSGGRELVAKEPQMLAYRITLALAHLKNGQQEAAMKVFDGITLDPAQIQPYQRAVLAAVLGANGREAEARQLARSVPGDAVTVQEYELIAPWREGTSE
ncbi:MAG: tetratricopeptide repeat protein [Chthoniobacterales bacterium]